MIELDFTDFYDEIDKFTVLPGKIDELSITAFQAVYGSDAAAKAENIIYIFMSEKPVPRLVGDSRVLYIGYTTKSFRTRRYKDAKIHAESKANSLKYSSILKNYDAISVRVYDYKRYGNSAQEAEQQLLWWYFQNHCEYPPINYTKTKVRNDKVIVG